MVIAANAGGAWTPIGDVTTTMLWIHGQISTLSTMKVVEFFYLTASIFLHAHLSLCHNGENSLREKGEKELSSKHWMTDCHLV